MWHGFPFCTNVYRLLSSFLSLPCASACAATEAIHVFCKRNGDKLECFSHRRVDVDQINEVVCGGPEAQGHRRLMDHLTRVHTKHGDADYPPRRALDHHFDHAARVADGSCSWHCAERDGVTLTDHSCRIRLLVGHTHHCHLG